MQETRHGGKSLTGAALINSIDWTSKGIGGGIGAQRLVKNWANSDPKSTLDSFKGLLEIGAALTGPGVSEYLTVQTGAIDAATALLSALEKNQLISNAKSIINSGLLYEDIGGPLSRAWFREQAPILAIKYPWF